MGCCGSFAPLWLQPPFTLCRVSRPRDAEPQPLTDAQPTEEPTLTEVAQPPASGSADGGDARRDGDGGAHAPGPIGATQRRHLLDDLPMQIRKNLASGSAVRSTTPRTQPARHNFSALFLTLSPWPCCSITASARSLRPGHLLFVMHPQLLLPQRRHRRTRNDKRCQTSEQLPLPRDAAISSFCL